VTVKFDKNVELADAKGVQIGKTIDNKYYGPTFGRKPTPSDLPSPPNPPNKE
jgi:hypothetical protein